MTNPFVELESFEELRASALAGETQFQNYIRRTTRENRRLAVKTFEVRLTERVRRMIDVGVASSRSVLLVGPPGTGKTEILEQLISRADDKPQFLGLDLESVDAVWITPEEEWSYESMVMGETVRDGEIVSTEGHLLRAIRLNQWLVLDEANRADLDRVLGGVLTWLSGKRVRIGEELNSTEKRTYQVYLDWTASSASHCHTDSINHEITYFAGADWRILGTYNATDAQRVFRMGQALSRRFKHIPVPPASAGDFAAILQNRISDDENRDVITSRIVQAYSAHLAASTTALGPALFLDVPGYIEQGLRMRSAFFAETRSEVDPGDKTTHSADQTQIRTDLSLLEELLAEGYLISVGHFLARYDPEDLADLGDRLVRNLALSAASWDWILDNLDSIRS